MGNRISLTNVIVPLQKYEMPVRFLWYVDKHMVTELGDSDEVSGFGSWKTLKLSSETIKPLKKASPSLPFGERTAVQTLYHEATHAYIELRQKDADVAALMAHGKQYYEGAPLTRGETGDDPERLFHEAAASYVGHRAASWWSTLEAIVTYGEMIEGDAKKPRTARMWATDKAMHQIADLVHKIRQIPNEYNKEMGRRTFGYEDEWKGLRRVQTETTKRMPDRLKVFCDTVLLEDKIPDDFFRATPLVKRYNALRQLVAPLSVAPRSQRGGGQVPGPLRK